MTPDVLNALEAARHELVTLHGLWATDHPRAYAEAQEDGADANGAYDALMETFHQLDTRAVIAQLDAVLPPVASQLRGERESA